METYPKTYLVFADIPFILYPRSAATPGTPGADEFLFPLMYAVILVFDAVYAVLMYRKCREAGINPWKRA